MAGRITVRRSALLRICILVAAAMTALLAVGPAAASASVSTPEGPVAAWSFDEGEGTVAHDATGWHDGTVEGALWSTGKFGSGLRFEEGEHQCVYVPDSEALDFEGGELTLEAWVKPEHWLGSAPIIAKEAEPGHGESYTFGIGMTKYGHVEGYAENAGVSSPGTVEEDTWIHIAFTYDGTVERIYLDGELAATKAVGPQELAGSGPLKIGCSGPEYGGQFKGRIDEVRAYTRALDEAEIKSDEGTPIGRPAKRRPAIAAWGFDEGAGTVAHDATGAGHTGTVEGPEWTTGKIGGGLRFLDNGEKQCVTVPDASELEFLNDEFTFEAWVKPEHWLGSAPIVFKEAEPEHGQDYTFGIGMTKYGHVEGWSENAVVYSPGTVEEDTWLHIAFTYDGNQERIYLNGKLVSSETIGKRNLAGSGPMKIGCSGPEDGGQFFGVVDEVRAYDRALTEAEIAEDEATPVDIPGPSQAPVAEYSFDEDKGEVAEDLTGNGHTATVHGAEWTEHGRYGGAMQFDAPKHDYLSVPSSPGLDFDEEFTLEAWVRPDSEENVAAPVMAKEVGGGSASETVAYHLFEGWSEPNRPAAGLESDPGNEQTAVASEPLPVDGWSHLAVSYDGSELRLYVNGQKVAEEAAPHGPMVTEGELQIGALTEHNNYFDGRIDEIRIYNRALNAGEVGADLGTPIQTPRRGPVAEYSFDQEASLGEDSSYGGPDATLEGATWTPNGRYGGGVLLDGKEDSLSIPSSPGLDLDEEFTLEAWVRPEGENKWAPLISKEREGTKEEPWFLYEGSWKSNLPYGGLEGETAGETISNANEQIPENRWTHLALTFDGTKTRLYVDGELVDEDAGTRPAAGEGRIDIGADASGNYFDGRIDEVRLYNRALAGGEVAASMETPIQTPKAGPVAAWSFDEGTGEIAADSAGEHDLTLEGPKWAPHGKFGSALDFNGGYEDCARTPNAEDLQLGEDFTISAWIKPEGNGEHEAILFKEAEYTGGYALYLGEFEDGHIEGYVGEPGYQFATTEDPKAMPHNAWTDVTLTFDGADLRLFVNGELVDTAAANGAQASGGPLSVGCSGEFHDGFIGGIDNVRVYNRALNAGEVASDMEAPIQTPKSGPVAEYSFDEGTGETVQDATGDGNTATIHGAEWTEHGRYGDAMNFEGGEDCLTIPVTEELQLTEEFTLEAWVRPVGEGEEALPVISMADEHSPGAEEPYGYELLAGQSERPKAWVRKGGESGFRGVYGAGPLPQNTWAHITLTDDGEMIRLYEDGHLAEGGLSTNAAPYLTTAEGPLEIGCGAFNGSFKGRIDEVRIYDRALDETEVSSDMEDPIQTPKWGPVAAYSFDEGEGGTVEDLTGDEHTATIHSARWTTHGRNGGAMDFNAARESYLSIPDSSELDFTEEFTLEAWVRPGEESGKYGPLITKQTPGSRAHPYFLWEGSWDPDRPFGGTDDNTEAESNAVSPEVLPTNTWSHLALTFDGSKSRLYIDGELVAVKCGSESISSEGDLEIGGATEVGSYFTGRVDDARIYSRALTQPEIDQTMTAGFPTAATEASLDEEANAATLTGTANQNGGEAEYYFEYGLTKAYGSFVEGESLGDPNEPVGVANAATDLMPETTYHYRLVVEGLTGIAYGKDSTFTTANRPEGETAAEEAERRAAVEAFKVSTAGKTLPNATFFGLNWSGDIQEMVGKDLSDNKNRFQDMAAAGATVARIKVFAGNPDEIRESLADAAAANLIVLPYFGDGAYPKAGSEYHQREDWLTFARTFMEEYGPGGTSKLPNVTDVEIWNEPNMPFPEQTSPEVENEPNPAGFAVFFNEMVEAIEAGTQKNKSSLNILAPGLFGYRSTGHNPNNHRYHIDPKDFLEKMDTRLNNIPGSAGSGDYSAVSIHPYVFKVGGAGKHVPKATPEDALSVQSGIRQALVEVRKFDKPIWVTEIGFPTANTEGGPGEKEHPGIGEKAQKVMTEAALSLLQDEWKQLNVSHALYYNIQDLATNKWENHCGLLKAGKRAVRKEAFGVYHDFAAGQ